LLRLLRIGVLLFEYIKSLGVIEILLCYWLRFLGYCSGLVKALRHVIESVSCGHIRSPWIEFRKRIFSRTLFRILLWTLPWTSLWMIARFWSMWSMRSLRSLHILHFSSPLMLVISTVIIKLGIIYRFLISILVFKVVCVWLIIFAIVMTSFYLLISILTLQEILLEIIIASVADRVFPTLLSSYWYVNGVFVIIVKMLLVKTSSIIAWFFEHVLIVDVVHFPTTKDFFKVIF